MLPLLKNLLLNVKDNLMKTPQFKLKSVLMKDNSWMSLILVESKLHQTMAVSYATIP